MPHLVSIYDLYDEKSFRYWEREIAKGWLPTSVELTALLNANRNAQLPVWLIPIIDNRDSLKRRTGRPRNSALKEIRVQLAIAKYRRYLQWLKKRSEVLASWDGLMFAAVIGGSDLRMSEPLEWLQLDGNPLARRVLIEGAWTYRMPARVSPKPARTFGGGTQGGARHCVKGASSAL